MIEEKDFEHTALLLAETLPQQEEKLPIESKEKHGFLRIIALQAAVAVALFAGLWAIKCTLSEEAQSVFHEYVTETPRDEGP